MEDIEEMSCTHESELATLKAELDWRGPAPSGTEAKCVQLRSQVAGLEDELVDLTQRFVALDHTLDEERVVLEASRAEASSRANGLALELVHARAYIHSTLSIEYGRDGNNPSKPQLAFHCLQTELAEREEVLRVTTTEVDTLWALLETERQGSTSDFAMERGLVCL